MIPFGVTEHSASGIAGRAVVLFVMGTGCYQWPVVTPDPLATTAPNITTAAVDCDVPSARWTFDITADAWTGQGKLFLSADGDYIEQHSVPSIEAPADGSADTLRRQLNIVATWRDASANSSTAFGCGTPALTGVMLIYSRDGTTATDCVNFGEDPSRWAIWNAVLACDTLIPGEVTDSGDSGA